MFYNQLYVTADGGVEVVSNSMVDIIIDALMGIKSNIKIGENRTH
jgi:hypothetical protein